MTRPSSSRCSSSRSPSCPSSPSPARRGDCSSRWPTPRPSSCWRPRCSPSPSRLRCASSSSAGKHPPRGAPTRSRAPSSAIYRPFVFVALRNPRSTIAIGLLAVLSAVPLALQLGSEFMPPLNEGVVLYMPITFPNISIEEVKRQLQLQDRILRSFPEVASGLRQGRTRGDGDGPGAAHHGRDDGAPEAGRGLAQRGAAAVVELLGAALARAGLAAALARPGAHQLGGAHRRDEPGDAVPRLDERLHDAHQGARRHALHRRPHAGRHQDHGHRSLRNREGGGCAGGRPHANPRHAQRLLRAERGWALPRHRAGPRRARPVRPHRRRRAAHHRGGHRRRSHRRDGGGPKPLLHQRALPAGSPQRPRAPPARAGPGRWRRGAERQDGRARP